MLIMEPEGTISKLYLINAVLWKQMIVSNMLRDTEKHLN